METTTNTNDVSVSKTELFTQLINGLIPTLNTVKTGSMGIVWVIVFCFIAVLVYFGATNKEFYSMFTGYEDYLYIIGSIVGGSLGLDMQKGGRRKLSDVLVIVSNFIRPAEPVDETNGIPASADDKKATTSTTTSTDDKKAPTSATTGGNDNIQLQ